LGDYDLGAYNNDDDSTDSGESQAGDYDVDSGAYNNERNNDDNDSGDNEEEDDLAYSGALNDDSDSGTVLRAYIASMEGACDETNVDDNAAGDVDNNAAGNVAEDSSEQEIQDTGETNYTIELLVLP